MFKLMLDFLNKSQFAITTNYLLGFIFAIIFICINLFSSHFPQSLFTESLSTVLFTLPVILNRHKSKSSLKADTKIREEWKTDREKES